MFIVILQQKRKLEVYLLISLYFFVSNTYEPASLGELYY